MWCLIRWTDRTRCIYREGESHLHIEELKHGQPHWWFWGSLINIDHTRRQNRNYLTNPTLWSTSPYVVLIADMLFYNLHLDTHAHTHTHRIRHFPNLKSYNNKHNMNTMRSLHMLRPKRFRHSIPKFPTFVTNVVIQTAWFKDKTKLLGYYGLHSSATTMEPLKHLDRVSGWDQQRCCGKNLDSNMLMWTELCLPQSDRHTGMWCMHTYAHVGPIVSLAQ